MALALCLTLLPAPAWAADPDGGPAVHTAGAGTEDPSQQPAANADETAQYVAEIVETGVPYTDLVDALDDAKSSQTVRLLANATMNRGFYVGSGESVTLDLNGHDISPADSFDDNRLFQAYQGGGTLRVTGEGTIRSDRSNIFIFTIFEDSRVIIESGVTVTNTGSSCIYIGNNGSVVDIYGTVTTDGAFSVQGNGTQHGTTINIYPGAYIQGESYAIYHPQDGDLNIFGGTLVGSTCGIEMRNGTITVSGDAKITGGTGGPHSTSNDSGSTTSNAALAIAPYEGTTIGVNISGGTFNGGAGLYASHPNDTTGTTPSTINLNITGGTFIGGTFNGTNYSVYSTGETGFIHDGSFSLPVAPEYLDDSLNTELKQAAGDAPYSYYPDLTTALASAGPGDTVTDVRAATTCTVTLDYGDGSAATNLVVAENTAVTLPTPSRSGYAFLGWYLPDGTRVSSPYTITNGVTLTARWSYISPVTQEEPSGGSDSEPSYSPVQDVSEGGTVKISPRTAEEGDTVTLTPIPDEGYEVDEISVTDRQGRTVDLTDNGDGTYSYQQPYGRVTISVTFRAVSAGADLPFTDVPEDYWAAEEIAWAYENGYVSGTSASAFHPEGAVSRQQVWMILARLDGYNPEDMAAAQAWAMSTGISDGASPGGAVTRQQLAALLYRFAQSQGLAAVTTAEHLTGFPDGEQVSAYAVQAMNWAVASGILGGTSQGTLNPQGTATRAQFAVMLHRLLH